MRAVATRLRTRLLPAILTALGVTFIAAGLLSYTNSVSAVDPSAEPDPTEVAVLPSPSLITIPPPSPKPSGSSSPSALPVALDHVATRVVIPALRIDLPIVNPPGGENAYPLCNVAMYVQELHQPGQGGATYIYAHARTGMFLPLLDQSKINNGAGMKGDLVQVYTSDNMLYEYVITSILRHVPKSTGYDRPFATTHEELWLQTSEGPHGTPTVLQLVAAPLDVQSSIDPAVAQPKPHPVVCG